MTRRSPCFRPAYRLVPSRFPPIGLFDTVASPADMEAVMELAGWTNDRLVEQRIRRLPASQWPVGRANASIVMAAFLHVAPGGMRFNGPLLGAWYAGDTLRTSIAEVGHHLRREAHATGLKSLTRDYRCYVADIDGLYLDLTAPGETPDGIADPADYAAAQVFGEGLRASGEAGLLYNSVRLRGGVNVAAYIPSNIDNVTQADHFRLTVFPAVRRIEIARLNQT